MSALIYDKAVCRAVHGSANNDKGVCRTDPGLLNTVTTSKGDLSFYIVTPTCLEGHNHPFHKLGIYQNTVLTKLVMDYTLHTQFCALDWGRG